MQNCSVKVLAPKWPEPRAIGLAGNSGNGEDGHIGEFEGQTGIGASACIGTDIAVGPVQAEIVAEAVDVAVRTASRRGELRLVFVVVAYLDVECRRRPIPARLVLRVGRGRSVAELCDDVSGSSSDWRDARFEDAAIHERRCHARGNAHRSWELHIAIIGFDEIVGFVVCTVAAARNRCSRAIARIGRARREIGAVVVRVGATIRSAENRGRIRRGRGNGCFRTVRRSTKSDEIDNLEANGTSASQCNRACNERDFARRCAHVNGSRSISGWQGGTHCAASITQSNEEVTTSGNGGAHSEIDFVTAPSTARCSCVLQRPTIETHGDGTTVVQHNVIVLVRCGSVAAATEDLADDNRSTAAKIGARRGEAVWHVKLRSEGQTICRSSAGGYANLVGAIHEQSGSGRKRDGLVVGRHDRTGESNARGEVVQRNLDVAHARAGIHVRRQGRGVHRRRERHVHGWTGNGRGVVRGGCRDNHRGIRTHRHVVTGRSTALRARRADSNGRIRRHAVGTDVVGALIGIGRQIRIQRSADNRTCAVALILLAIVGRLHGHGRTAGGEVKPARIR